MKIEFVKMQGAGNDFVVIDSLSHRVALTAAQITKLCDRRLGVGADQVLMLEFGSGAVREVLYRIFNTDGTEAEHCGNGARCVALYLFERRRLVGSEVRLRTLNRVLHVRRGESGAIEVEMGHPLFQSGDVPFVPQPGTVRHQIVDQAYWRLADVPMTFAVATMGNPHAVAWVEDVDSAPLELLATALQQSRAFPKSVNVSVGQVVSRDLIRLRTFERAVGETMACGSGACAAAAIGRRSGLLDGRVEVAARGGHLRTIWDAERGITLAGPATFVFDGSLDL